MKRMTTIISGVVMAALVAVGGVSAQQAKHTGSIEVKNDDEAGFAEVANISLDSAINSALKQVPGKVVKAELENEDGYLVYGVEIAKTDHQMADVKVDAGSGKVLKIEADQKDNEGREGKDSDSGHEEVGER
jgi:uncharacterized membrane protein YkoI